MNDKLFIKADEVSKELGVSKAYAYKLVQKLNGELEEKGYVTISGRVSRQYFYEKFYGMKSDEKKGA
jgi:predicted transcriptional regulator